VLFPSPPPPPFSPLSLKGTRRVRETDRLDELMLFVSPPSSSFTFRQAPVLGRCSFLFLSLDVLGKDGKRDLTIHFPFLVIYGLSLPFFPFPFSQPKIPHDPRDRPHLQGDVPAVFPSFSPPLLALGCGKNGKGGGPREKPPFSWDVLSPR